jgi:hypothetical protein
VLFNQSLFKKSQNDDEMRINKEHFYSEFMKVISRVALKVLSDSKDTYLKIVIDQMGKLGLSNQELLNK